MKKIAFILLISFVITFPVFAVNKVDIVTYADFSHIRDIAVSLNAVYFATSEGVIKYDRFSKNWDEPLNGSPGIDYRSIFQIYVDQFDRKLYARTETNSYEYDTMFKDWYFVNEIPTLDNNTSNSAPSSIMYVPPGYVYSGDGYVIDQAGIEYPINRVVKDGADTKWMGIWGLGAAKASSGDMIEFLPYGLIQNRVNTIYNSNGEIIVGGGNIGTSRTGLTFFDVDNNKFSYKESGVQFDFPDDDVSCIEEDENNLYVGTIGGVIIFDNETLEVKDKLTNRRGLISNEVLSLKKYKNQLFIGTLYGLQMLDRQTDSLKLVYPNQFQNQEIYDLELTDSSLWIASSVGAFQLNLKTYDLKKFQDPHNLTNGRILNIERTGNNIFIASQAGMVRLNLKTGKTTSFVSDAYGLNYRGLAANDDVAFLTTDRGFEIYYLTDSGYSNEREFTTSDGIPSQYVYDLLLDGDYLWIGTDRGLSLFLWNDPDRID